MGVFLLVTDKSEVLECLDGSGFSLCLTRVKSKSDWMGVFLIVIDKSEVLECLDGSGFSL